MHGREKKGVSKKVASTASGVSSPTAQGASPYHSYGHALDELGYDSTQFDAMLDTLQSDKKAKSLETIGTILGHLRVLDNNTSSHYMAHGATVMSAMESALATNKKATLKDRVAIIQTGTLLASTHGDDILELYDTWANVCFQSVAGSAASSNLKSALGAACFDGLSIINACNPSATVQIGGSGNQGRGGSIAEGLMDLVMRRGYQSAVASAGVVDATPLNPSTIPSSVIAASIPTLYTAFFGGSALGGATKDVTNNTNNPDENDDGSATSGGIATGAAASSAAAAAAAALLLEGSPSDLSFAAFLKCLALSCEASQSRKVRGVIEGAIAYFIGLNPVPSISDPAAEFPTNNASELLSTVSPATTVLIVRALEAAAILNSRFPLLFASPTDTSNPTSGNNSIPQSPNGSNISSASGLAPFVKFSLNTDGLKTLRKLIATSGATMGKAGKRLLSKAIRSLEASFPDMDVNEDDVESDDDAPRADTWGEDGVGSDDEDDSGDDNDGTDGADDGFIIKIRFRKSKAVVIVGYHRCVLTQLFRGLMEGGFHRHVVHNSALQRVLRPTQAGMVDDDDTVASSYKERKGRMIQQQVANKRANDKERSKHRDQKDKHADE